MKKILLSLGLLAGTGAFAQTQTLFQIVEASATHTILQTALENQGLDVTLNDPNIDYTLFAPTDAAFSTYLATNNMTANDLLTNSELTKILLHHVLGANVSSSMLMNNTEVVTLSELDVSVTTMGGAMIDSSNVDPNLMDVAATNGVLHSIDFPLMPTYDNVTEVISTSPDHDTLLLALQTANLVSTLADENASFTVFAPTDAAFNMFLTANSMSASQLLADPDLATILMQHVISGSIESGSLSNGEVLTLTGLDVTVDISNGVMIDDAMVTTADIMTDNGIVHVIGDVLLPTYDDVTEIISTSEDHDTLLLALQTANLVTTLQDQNSDFTVFAPTDAAFNTFLTMNGLSANDLLMDPSLTNILMHHVVSGAVQSSMLMNSEVATLSMLDVTIDVTNNVMVDDAEVTLADILADNGVVHVIDGILLPTYDDVTEVISTSADHDTLLLALQTANLVTTLQNQNADFTVFAPTDAAFNMFLMANNMSANDLLNAPNLDEILLNHVLSGEFQSGSLVNGPITTLNNTDIVVDLTSGVMINTANVTMADILADNGVVHVIDGILEPSFVASIDDNQGVEINIFPNPSSDIINVEGIPSGENYVIYAADGSVVSTAVLNQNQINIESLSPGLYFFSTSTGIAKSFTVK